MHDRIDLGSTVVPGGYFLTRSAPDTPFAPAPSAADSGYRHCFSYRGSDPTIRDAAVEFVRRARRKVFLASFRIGDKLLLDAMFDAVERLRGGVYVITSWDERRLREGLAALEDNADADVAAQRHRFDEMTRRGIFLRGHDSCHAKFLVVDDEAALVSSANLETSALADRRERQVTGESGVVLTDAAEVNRLSRLFTRLWYGGCRWEAPPGEEYALAARRPVTAPCVPAQPRVADRPAVIWTHDDERPILYTLHDIIDRAQDELLLATFGLRGLADRPALLHDRLAAARQRGVHVTLLCRGRNNMPGHRAEAAALARLGVRVVGDGLTHAKGAIADGRHGAIFSANLDSEHGLTSGVEVGVRLDGSPALAEAHRYLTHAIDNADLTFALNPTQSQLNDGFAARWRRTWPVDRTLIVSAADRDWQALAEAPPPILYTRRSDSVRLLAGGGEWLLADGHMRMTARPTNPAGTVDLINSWRRGSTRGERRGFCPAELVRATRTR